MTERKMIGMEEEREISLGDPCFWKFREDFDKTLKRALDIIRTERLDEAVIGIKLKIKIRDKVIETPTKTNMNQVRFIEVPVFEHKMQTNYKVETKAEYAEDTDMELVFDEATGKYSLAKIEQAQTSMLDDDRKGVSI